MKKPLFADTNIFLRFLTADDPRKYGRCRELFRRAAEGEAELETSALVIAELVWTLSSFYKVPKAGIIEKISVIIGTDAIRIPDKDVIAEALVLYGMKNIDYIDAYNASFMRARGIENICSYDEDFDLIEGIKRREP